MNKIFAGIQIPDKPQEFIPLTNIDFNQDVTYLKNRIAEEIKFNDANNLELVFDGRALANDIKLNALGISENAVVHCFQKTKEYTPFKPTDKFKNPEAIAHIQNLFTLIAHIQINVASRVTIWQKILNEYPEFRRNLGAQAFIRDSVLFNTIHQSETINKIAENYPIICEAAPFIVDTIKKELARNAAATSNNLPSGTVNDSPNSSEEENSLGANGSSATVSESGSAGTPSERTRIREIMRQQLQDALAHARIANNVNSINSLSNIAQRNADSNTATLNNSTSGDRISAEMLRQHLQRAFGMLPGGNNGNNTSVAAQTSTADDVQPMDTTETNTSPNDDNNDVIPTNYRTHEYAEQLRTMSQMGFRNHEDNITFLNLTNGNIENAINLLMAAMNE